MNLKTFLYLPREIIRKQSFLFMVMYLTGFTLILYSCGKDTVNNITNPPTTTDSLIYSKDSLVVYTSGNVHFDIDSLLPNKYKISFDASTDDTSSNAELDVLAYYYQDSTHHLINDIFTGNQINQTYNKSFTQTDSHELFIYSSCGFLSSNPGKYVRMKNIKVYIVH